MRWAAFVAACTATFSLQRGFVRGPLDSSDESQKKVDEAFKLLKRAQKKTEAAGKLVGVFEAPTKPPPMISKDFPIDEVIARAVDSAVAARIAAQTPPPPNATNATAGALPTVAPSLSGAPSAAPVATTASPA